MSSLSRRPLAKRAADETAGWSRGRLRRTPPGIAGPRSSSNTAARSRACPTIPGRCARTRGCRRGAMAGSTSWRADRNCDGCRRSGSIARIGLRQTLHRRDRAAHRGEIGIVGGHAANGAPGDDCALGAERRIGTEQRKRRAAGHQKRPSVEHAKHPHPPDGEEVSNVCRQTNSMRANVSARGYRGWLARVVNAIMRRV